MTASAVRPRGGPAVMARRHEPADALDDFPTPPWAGRALCEWLVKSCGVATGCLVALEPAAGRGYLARALREHFRTVIEADVVSYGRPELRIADFLGGAVEEADWIITNPPFRLAERFAVRALGAARCGVALLVRTQFLEGVGRFERLFSIRPPTAILQFSERVAMVGGRVDPAASTATAYCWLVWNLADLGGASRLFWLPPCRRRLERGEDWL